MTARPNEQRAHDELARAKAPAPNIPDTAAPRFSPRRRDGRSQRPRDCKTTREHTCISQQLNRAERERRRSERGERERRDSARDPADHLPRPPCASHERSTMGARRRETSAHPRIPNAKRTRIDIIRQRRHNKCPRLQPAESQTHPHPTTTHRGHHSLNSSSRTCRRTDEGDSPYPPPK
jgi:hypothetical protein